MSAETTKPMGPADGAADYKQNSMGPPLDKPIVPVPSGEPTKPPKEPGGPEPTVVECPPTCSPQGGWIGCGLTKIRGSKCQGCTPKCKGKGTPDEGWYDCAGVLIVNRPCGN
ncbi:MAG: hypothetical protein ACXWVM_29900 [Polyangiales bacterium]